MTNERDAVEFVSRSAVELVSLCTIAYNEEDAIDGLFAAIVAQDYPHECIEVILVDGLSIDSTRQKMEDFSTTAQQYGFSQIKVVDNPGRIQPSGWNVAIQSSSGDVIIRVDAHAWIPPDFVRQSVETIEGGENVCGGVRPTRLWKDTPWRRTLLCAEESIFGSSIASYRRDDKPREVASLFHGCYRREVFETVGLFDERLMRTEDNEIHYRIRQHGFRIWLNPAIHSYQYVRSSFVSLIKQKEQNGYWIGRTLFICPKCLQTYHLVPLAFVVVIALALAIGLTCAWMPLIALACLYGIVDVVLSVISIVQAKQKHLSLIALPFIILTMHLAYGWGTLLGIIGGIKRGPQQPYQKRKPTQ